MTSYALAAPSRSREMWLPRICSIPPCSSSMGDEAVELCAMAGLELDDWQAFTLSSSLGQRPNGKWAAFEIGVDVSRQNGKGGLLEGRELTGLFLISERLIVHSSHQFDTSLEAFRRLLMLIEQVPEFDRRVRRVSRSHGEEGIELKGGQRIRFRTRTKGGGRGFTGDCLILDEAMILPESSIGALLPTLSARPNPQVWYTGSSVDQRIHDEGMVFSRIRQRGLRGGDPSLAYFEWSLDAKTPTDVTPEQAADPAVWAQANPGLGIRISAEHVEHERLSMDPRTFAVERLGVGDWPTVGEAATVIPLERWAELTDPQSAVIDPVCFAFDIPPDRSYGTIGVAGRRADGLLHTEIVEYRRGTGWIVDRLAELAAKHKAKGIVYDGSGPAASLTHDLDEADIETTPVTAREHGQACGALLDLVDQRKLRHLGTNELTSAIRGAAKRPLGDAFVWSRKSSAADISPLVAATLALWGATEIPEPEPVTPRAISLADV